jgi:hypothetical protein
VSDIPANLEVGLPKDDYFHCGNVDELSEKLGNIIEAPLQHVDYYMSKYDWDRIADEVGGQRRAVDGPDGGSSRELAEG